jgi:hypothetical protein
VFCCDAVRHEAVSRWIGEDLRLRQGVPRGDPARGARVRNGALRADERIGSALIHSEMFRDLRDRAVVLADLVPGQPERFLRARHPACDELERHGADLPRRLRPAIRREALVDDDAGDVARVPRCDAVRAKIASYVPAGTVRCIVHP